MRLALCDQSWKKREGNGIPLKDVSSTNIDEIDPGISENAFSVVRI
jgi:hypothetical protein